MSHGTAVLKAAAAGMARRLVQTVVVFVVLTIAATAAVVGLTLAATPALAFQAVSARYHSADLAVTIDATKVTSAQLARTRRLPGVTGAVGDPATTVDITIPGTPGYEGGAAVSGPVTVVGRASRSGPLDDITQKTGRWPARPGEIDMNDLSQTRGSVGQVATATVTSLPGKPKLTIVGFASLPVQDDTQDTWVLPGEITALEKAGAPKQELMLYTFSNASTVAQVSSDLTELRAALPAGTIISYATALSSASQDTTGAGIRTSSNVPYTLTALLLAAVIIASVAAGAVTAGYRRIGVLKSIGFTPAQVVAVYLTQLGIPALAGSLAGTALGSRWVLPRIQENPVFNVTVAVPAWIDIAVPAAMLALTGLAALVPAVQAGRLPAVQAITAGQAPAAGHGHAARRLTDKLPLPRPVTAGLAAPFTRPSRSAATLATITVGLTAAVLAAGLSSQITKIVLSIGIAEIDRALFGRLTWLVVILAGTGVFATLLTQARERVRELGIHKALGMTPWQVITMVTCWAVAPAIIAAAIALPAGTVLEPVVARAVVSAQAGPAENMTPFMPRVPGGPGAAPAPRGLHTQGVPGRAAPSGQAAPSSGALRNAPPSPRQSRIVQQSGSGQQPGQSVRTSFAGMFRTAGQNPYTPAELALLALAGLAIALAGALGPAAWAAAWAAASRTTTALRAE
jgi:ABC-type antimicrobial peptide transport system permease subunit